MKKLGRSTQINIHNTRSLIRTPKVCLKHLAEGKSLHGGTHTHTHTHTHTRTHTHTHTHIHLVSYYPVNCKLIEKLSWISLTK